MERFSLVRDCGSIPHGDSTVSMFYLKNEEDLDFFDRTDKYDFPIKEEQEIPKKTYQTFSFTSCKATVIKY